MSDDHRRLDDKMAFDNALAIKELTANVTTLTKDVDKVVKTVEKFGDKEYEARVSVLESKVRGLMDGRSKLIWAVMASWIGLIGYTIKFVLTGAGG